MPVRTGANKAFAAPMTSRDGPNISAPRVAAYRVLV